MFCGDYIESQCYNHLGRKKAKNSSKGGRLVMGDICRICYPLLICLIWYYSLLSSHPSDFNIPTQYSHHKTVSSEHALALVIGLNTNNLATEKGSASKTIYKPKSGVSDGYAWIGSILIIFVLSPFFSVAIICALECLSISPLSIWMRNHELHQPRPNFAHPIPQVQPSPLRCGVVATLWYLSWASCTNVT